jgi:hypothetical protein
VREDGVLQLLEGRSGVSPGGALVHDPLRLAQAHVEYRSGDLDRLDRREPIGAQPREDRIPVLVRYGGV